MHARDVGGEVEVEAKKVERNVRRMEVRLRYLRAGALRWVGLHRRVKARPTYGEGVARQVLGGTRTSSPFALKGNNLTELQGLCNGRISANVLLRKERSVVGPDYPGCTVVRRVKHEPSIRSVLTFLIHDFDMRKATLAADS